MRAFSLIAVAAVASSCTQTRPAARAAPTVASPPRAACAAYLELRAAESGRPLPPPPPLRIDAADEHFRRAAAFGFSGGLRMIRSGRVLLSRSYGYADHARRTPMSEDAVFNIGSVAKQFTAAAILRLEELGRLRTADSIDRHLPGVPEDKRGITIHQLLSHQAGLRHSMPNLARAPERDAAVRELLGTELLHPAGTRFSYSNVGYALLAAIVDRRSLRGYEAFLRDELWLPLGMRRTGMVLPDWREAQIADGLEFTGPVPVQPPEEWSESGTTWLSRGAGGMSSTMPDLTRWAEALRTGTILSDASRRKLFWPHSRMNTRQVIYYGYGWAIGAAPDGSCTISHNGGGGIHYDVLTIFPGHETVAVAFNTQQRTPWRVGDNFVETLTPVLAGAAPSLPETAAAPPAEALAGLYVLPSGHRIRVVSERGRLRVPMDSAAALRLFAPWPEAPAQLVASLGDRRRLVSDVMSGIAAGDYRPLLSRLPANVAAQAEMEFWGGYWPRLLARLGAYAGAELVGTVIANDAPRTLVRLAFARGSTVVAFVHGADGTTFIDVVPSAFYPETYLAPAPGGGFQAYYPTTARAIPVRFDRAAMTIGTGDATVTARRAAVP